MPSALVYNPPMTFSETKLPETVFLTLVLVLVAPVLAYAQPPQTHALGDGSEVYIYYAGFLSRHFCCDSGPKCCDVRFIDDLLHLDGTNDWGSPIKAGKECLLKPPKSNEIYASLLPYLSRAKEGLFNTTGVIFKIINTTTGKDTYVDRDGGMFTPGERITRQMTVDDFNAMRAIMDDSGCNERLKEY